MELQPKDFIKRVLNEALDSSDVFFEIESINPKHSEILISRSDLRIIPEDWYHNKKILSNFRSELIEILLSEDANVSQRFRAIYILTNLLGSKPTFGSKSFSKIPKNRIAYSLINALCLSESTNFEEIFFALDNASKVL